MKFLLNAHVYTFDRENPLASAIALQGDRILAAGEASELRQRFSGRCQEVDLGGKTILPGLTDSHLHLEQYALSLRKINCETSSKAECLQRLRERVSEVTSGEWILGHGWNQNNWPEGYGSIQELDSIAPVNPVFLTAKSLHAAWVNSRAFQLAGISQDSVDPPNGVLGRDMESRLSGIVFENAVSLIEKSIPAPSVEKVAESLLIAQQDLWQKGLTCVHDFDRARCLAALQVLHANNKLKLRVLKSLPYEHMNQATEIGLRSGFGDDYLRIGGVKIFADGALGPRTAAMFQPYEQEPLNTGLLFLEADDLYEIGRRAVDAGLSLAVHAIGDRANHLVLNAYERLVDYERQVRFRPSLPHRIEHLQIIRPDDAPRLARYGVVASMQPLHATSDMEMAERSWGNRSAQAYGFKTQLECGASLVFGSDAPVESPNPFLGIHAAVTRRRLDGEPGVPGWYPEQRLTVQQAIEAYTLTAATISGWGDRLGKIAPGYLADLVILNRDPFACQPEELPVIKPLKTMVSGDWVFEG